jgi:hypothetical protein
MKIEISESDFIRAFDDYDRSENFSVSGRIALYNYLTEEEDSTGEEINLDVIGICCDFNEYNDIEEYLMDYNTTIDRKDFDDIEDYKDAVKDEIRNKTILIEIDDDSFIIQAY